MSLDYLGSYINGDFEFSGKSFAARSQAFLGKTKSQAKNQNSKPALKAHVSPADFEDKIFIQTPAALSPVGFACEKGKEAYLPWARLSLEARAQKLKPLKQIIKKELKSLSQIIARETGKPLWESEGEAKSLISKIDFVLGEGLNRIREKNIPQAKGRIRFKSRGLLAVIGPFNFPMHLPLGQILPALASGNTVIFKPSEKTPACGQRLADMFHKINLPPGVFQMLQAGPENSKKLCAHNLVDGALFTGSFKTGQKIKESLLKDPHKILALEMGGYNSALVWDDKNYETALSESLKGCFWTAGQRCSSTSQIILHKKLAGKFIKDFIHKAKQITADHWRANPFMGCLIDRPAVERFFALQEEIQKLGGEVLLKGQSFNNQKGYYVRPGLYKMKFDKNSAFGTEESFTPQAVIYETEDLDEALDMINHSGYGLSLSVFSEDKNVREEIYYRAKAGLINYNLSSIGASGLLPFGGLGKSGNDRPAGAFAVDSCVSPLAERANKGF